MWPQYPLTHHVELSKGIETHPVNPVNPMRGLLIIPKPSKVQPKAGQQRMTGDTHGIIQNNGLLTRHIDIHFSPKWIDQPTQLCAVLDIFKHLEVQLRKVVARRSKLNDKIWTNRRKAAFLLFCQAVPSLQVYPRRIRRSYSTSGQSKPGGRVKTDTATIFFGP